MAHHQQNQPARQPPQLPPSRQPTGQQPPEPPQPLPPVQQVGRPPSSPSLPVWVQDAEDYLTSRGWTKLGSDELGRGVWADPHGKQEQRAEKRPAVTLPVAGGGHEVVSQYFLPPAAWDYTTEEALWHQRQRDAAGETLADVVVRKRKELEALEARLAQESKPESAVA
jgi:hypothetical protein